MGAVNPVGGTPAAYPRYPTANAAEVKTYALIINPDGNPLSDGAVRHLQNTAQTLERVETYQPDGVFLVSPKVEQLPSYDNILFATAPTQDNLSAAVAEIRKVIRPGDSLLIFVTGHGLYDEARKEAVMVFPGGEDVPADPRNVTESEFGQMLATMPDVNYTIFMDQCFGGAWRDTFSSSRTFFIASSGKEETFCVPWVKRLNSPDVPDLNQDGVISNVERLAYASTDNQIFDITTAMGEEYVDYGYGHAAAQPFYPNTPQKISTKAELAAWQAKNPNGVIVLKFGAEWCHPCRAFAPTYDAMANTFNGRVLFLSVDLTKDYATNELYQEFGQGPLPLLYMIKGVTRIPMNVEQAMADPVKMADEINQALAGTHPDVFIAGADAKKLAEDQTNPSPIRCRSLKIAFDQGAGDETWVRSFCADQDAAIRKAALEIITRLYVKRIDTLRVDQKDTTQWPAIAEEFVAWLTPFLGDASLAARIYAARWITTFERYPETIKSFMGEAVASPDPLIREDAMKTIGNMADPSYLPYLLTLVHDSDPLVQSKAIMWLGLARLEVFIPVLEQVIASETTSPENRTVARYYLKQTKEFPRPYPQGKTLEGLWADFNRQTDSDERWAITMQIWQLQQVK